MTKFDVVYGGLAVLGTLYLTYMVGGHGVPWVWKKVKALFGHFKTDVSDLVSRVSHLESAVNSHIAGHLAAPAAAVTVPHPPVPAAPAS